MVFWRRRPNETIPMKLRFDGLDLMVLQALMVLVSDVGRWVGRRLVGVAWWWQRREAQDGSTTENYFSTRAKIRD